jgi:hypothetical protein
VNIASVCNQGDERQLVLRRIPQPHRQRAPPQPQERIKRHHEHEESSPSNSTLNYSPASFVRTPPPDIGNTAPPTHKNPSNRRVPTVRAHFIAVYRMKLTTKIIQRRSQPISHPRQSYGFRLPTERQRAPPTLPVRDRQERHRLRRMALPRRKQSRR